MKKAKNTLAILSIIYSIFYMTILILKFFSINIVLGDYFFIASGDTAKIAYIIHFIILLINVVLSFVVIFKDNKVLSIIYLVLSLRYYNFFSIASGIISLKMIIDKEHQLRKEQIKDDITNINKPNDLNNTDIEFNVIDEKPTILKQKEYIVDNKYKSYYITSIILVAIYLILYLVYLIITVINNYKFIDSLINPVTVIEELGPGAIAFIVIYPLMLLAFAIIAIIYLIPVPILTFGLIMNISALKKDHHAIKILRFLGIINLTFFNSYRSFKIVDENKKLANES